ncbi:hypothetical protein ACKLNO_11145 [Neisseriaceae bacterium B1]
MSQCHKIPKAPIKRAFSVISVKKIRAFKSLDAASRFIDMRLQQKPAFNFNIQQSGDEWIVSRVIGA